MTADPAAERDRVLMLGREAEALAPELLRAGYDVRLGGAPERIEEAAFSHAPDAVVLALGAEDVDAGKSVALLRERETFKSLPILVLAPRELLDGPLSGILGAMTEGLPTPVAAAGLELRLRANLEIRRMLELGERRAERLMALYEISRAVNSTLDSGAILYIIARKISEAMELVRCSFIVPDLQNGVGHVIACKDDPNISSLEINLANYPEIIQVLRSGVRVLIDDVETSPIMAGIRKFADVFRDQSIMTLPLVFHQDIIGVLQIRKKSQRQGFTEREIEYCELLAAAAASALKNAQLYEDIERHNEELRRRKRELEQLSEELRRKNQELIELQRLKEEFSMMLVHDLRSPLMIVQGVLDLLRHRSGGKGPDDGLIGDGIEVTKRILQLINDLLEVSKLESGEFRMEFEPIDLAAFLEETLAPLRTVAGGRRVTVELSVEPGLPALVADRRGLAQVLDNLVANAFKFTPDGGQVRLRVERAQPDAVRMVVEDTGEGITSEELPDIFKKFHQGNKGLRKGHGLGLTIVEMMVRAHHGTVRAESEPGKGSRFTVELPLHRP